jgi:hypothetical protein
LWWAAKTTLQDWAEKGWLKRHTTSRQEVKNLLGIVERDLADAGRIGLSADWRFGIAYNAALKLCTVLLYASGYKPEKLLAHYRTLQSLPLILGDKHRSDAEYLETCRRKRNTAEYDYAGAASDADAVELSKFARGLQKDVLGWLREVRPELLNP